MAQVLHAYCFISVTQLYSEGNSSVICQAMCEVAFSLDKISRVPLAEVVGPKTSEMANLDLKP